MAVGENAHSSFPLWPFLGVISPAGRSLDPLPRLHVLAALVKQRRKQKASAWR